MAIIIHLKNKKVYKINLWDKFQEQKKLNMIDQIKFFKCTILHTLQHILAIFLSSCLIHHVVILHTADHQIMVNNSMIILEQGLQK